MLLLPFCKGRTLPAGQCVFNSDCDNNQICAGTYCRSQCNPANGQGDRDCTSMFGAGWRCRSSGQTSGQTMISVCTPPSVIGSFCVYSSDCTPPLVCSLTGQCATQCQTDYDCQTIALEPQASCIQGTCSFRDGGVSPDGGASVSDGAVTTDGAATDAATTDGPAVDGGG